MPKYTKAELEDKYGVPCYTQWRYVPDYLHARSWYSKGMIPRDAKPDAIKGGGGISKVLYFLFDENKYLSDERLEEIAVERKPVI